MRVGCRIVGTQEEVRMTAEGAVKEGRLVDDVRTGRHRIDGQGRRGAEIFASIRGRPIRPDLDWVPARITQVSEEAGFVLEPAFADDIELGIGAHRPFDKTRLGCALELGQVLARKVRDQIRGGIDGLPVDAIHAGQP